MRLQWSANTDTLSLTHSQLSLVTAAPSAGHIFKSR